VGALVRCPLRVAVPDVRRDGRGNGRAAGQVGPDRERDRQGPGACPASGRPVRRMDGGRRIVDRRERRPGRLGPDVGQPRDGVRSRPAEAAGEAPGGRRRTAVGRDAYEAQGLDGLQASTTREPCAKGDII